MEDGGVTGRLAIRPADRSDRAYVENLGKRTLRDSVSRYRPIHQAMLEASFDGLLDFVYSQPHVAFIADIEGAAAGFLLLLVALPDEVTLTPQAFVAYMAVEPSARRAGIGTQLLSAAEDEARRRGLPYMGLMVTEDNAPARSVYERAGYFTERRLLCKPL